MRWFIAGICLAVMVTGCGSGAAPSLAVPSSGPCAGIPLVDRDNPPDLLPLTIDPVLEALVPLQIDGQRVTDVTSGRYVETLCMVGGEEALAAALARTPAALDIQAINVASGKATVDDLAVSMTAYRLPGGSGADLTPILGKSSSELAPATVEGKPVLTWTDTSDGSTLYLYSSGDTLFVIEDATPSQAGTVLAALP